jgi:hypothetical protein
MDARGGRGPLLSLRASVSLHSLVYRSNNHATSSRLTSLQPALLAAPAASRGVNLSPRTLSLKTMVPSWLLRPHTHSETRACDRCCRSDTLVSPPDGRGHEGRLQGAAFPPRVSQGAGAGTTLANLLTTQRNEPLLHTISRRMRIESGRCL